MIDFVRSRKLESDITMPDLNEFMTTREAAKRLGFHVKTILMMPRNKTLGGIRFGRAWLVSKKSVDEITKVRLFLVNYTRYLPICLSLLPV